MSKTISNDLKTHLGLEVSTISTCWKITRQDGQEYFFTDHDIDLEIDGDTYEASSGFFPSAISQNKGLKVDNLDVFAFLDFQKIAEADIQAGLYDYADIDVFLINREDLTQGKLYLVGGWKLGEIEISDNMFRAEIRGKSQKLSQNIIDLYSPGCRAIFGDALCGIDLEASSCPYIVSGTVTGVTSREEFTDSGRTETEDVFRYGKITFLSGSTGGNNAGFSMEVKKFDVSTKTITLFQALPYDIEVGDEYELTYGCDKTADTCKDRFNNLINFRGEPFIPGYNKLFQTP